MKKKLTFGYLYDFRNPEQWRRPWADLYAETLDFITWSESIGFEGAWVPEHHGADDGYVPSPLVVLAAIAARTKTIKLGSAVALAPLYHPVRFAEECAVLDILSNGRLEMAVAVGYRRREADAYGVDFSSRGRRTDEFLEIVRRLWAGETFSYEGKHFSSKNASIRQSQFAGESRSTSADSPTRRWSAPRSTAMAIRDLEVCDLYLEKLRACGKDPAGALDPHPGTVCPRRQRSREGHARAGALFSPCEYNAYGQWLQRGSGAPRVSAIHALFKPMTLEAFKASGTIAHLDPQAKPSTCSRGCLRRRPSSTS